MTSRSSAKKKLIYFMDQWVKTFDSPFRNSPKSEYLQNEINFWRRKYMRNPSPIEWKDDGRYVCHVDIPEEYES